MHTHVRLAGYLWGPLPERKLIIEVDGGCHRDRRVADDRRERALRRLGYRVLRLGADLVLGAREEAVARVRAALG